MFWIRNSVTLVYIYFNNFLTQEKTKLCVHLLSEVVTLQEALGSVSLALLVVYLWTVILIVIVNTWFKAFCGHACSEFSGLYYCSTFIFLNKMFPLYIIIIICYAVIEIRRDKYKFCTLNFMLVVKHFLERVYSKHNVLKKMHTANHDT